MPQGLREGRLSLDQVGVIAARAGEGSDEHYAEMARCATVNQLRTAVKLEPRPEPDPRPEPQASITQTSDDEFTCWRIKLPHPEAAKFDAALASHRDALIAEWKLDRENHGRASDMAPSLPGSVEAFMRLVEAGWDAEVARRPHGHHTTVVVHLDVKQRAAALHLGPLLSEAERRYLTCDATCEVWFERDGQVIGAGRATRPDQPAASPRAGAPPSHVCGSGLWRHPRFARTPYSALGGRRSHRVVQLGTGVPLSPPAAPSRRYHHRWTRRRSHRHRQLRPTTQCRIAGASAEPSPARGGTVPRTYRRARRLVVVPTIPAAAATNKQLDKVLGHRKIR